MGLGGLIMQCCMFGVLIAVRAALDVNASIKSTDQGLAALHDGVFTINGAFIAINMLGFTIAGRKAGLLSPVQSVIGYAGALFLFLSAMLSSVILREQWLAELTLGAGWLFWIIWVIAYGLALIRFSRLYKM